jgi:acetoin utilization deacetylase AcuC-like enzyme
MIRLVTYLHPQAFFTSKPIQEISFAKYSLPYYNQVRHTLAKSLQDYPALSLRKAQVADYLRVHTHNYLRKLALKALGKPLDKSSLSLPELSFECRGLEHALPSYLYGLGGMLEAIDQMKRGLIDRAYCFSMVGHHAHSNWGHGYCLLNPLAATTRYAQLQGFEKILIIDWDIHHGDGTQEIFSNDRNVYCISIHSAVDIYMAKASDLKAGTTDTAKIVGHCNIPIITESFPVEVLQEEGITGKFYYGHESIHAYQEALENVPWQPNLIAIFSGYDSHKDDCGARTTNWTNDDFCKLTKITLNFAKKYGCPVLSSHGGGYKLSVTVSAAMAHIETLATYRGG